MLTWLVARRSQYGGTSWPDSLCASAGDIVLVADGMGSCSYPTLGRRPYLSEITTLIQSARPGTTGCGFSYVGPGLHYDPRNTDVTLLGDSARLFAPYQPTSGTRRRLSYVGFSLGGTLSLLGFAASLATNNATPIPPGMDTVSGLVLVQPALALTPTYLAAARSASAQVLPAPIVELMLLGPAVHQQVTRAVATILAAGVPIHCLYWDADRFLSYPPALLSGLQAMGVLMHPLQISTDLTTDPFVEHCRVAAHPVTLNALSQALASL